MTRRAGRRRRAAQLHEGRPGPARSRSAAASRSCWCTPASTTTSRCRTPSSTSWTSGRPTTTCTAVAGSHAVQTADVMMALRAAARGARAVRRGRLRRRQLHARLRARRREGGSADRPRRVRTALARPRDAGGGQPASRWTTSRTGCSPRAPTPTTNLAKRGHHRRPRLAGRQRHGRHAAAQPPPGEQSDVLERLGVARRRPRALDDAPAVERRRARGLARPGRTSRSRSSQDRPVVFPVHPRTGAAAATSRAAGACSSRRPASSWLPPLGYLDFLRLQDTAGGRPDRLRRRAGGDDRPRRALPHPARQHGAADHRHRGHQHRRRHRPRDDPGGLPRPRRRVPRTAAPRAGTAWPPSASPPCLTTDRAAAGRRARRQRRRADAARPRPGRAGDGAPGAPHRARAGGCCRHDRRPARAPGVTSGHPAGLEDA